MEPDELEDGVRGPATQPEWEDADPRSPADRFLDELMPPELEWRRVVRRHPIPALLVAAGVGYWLGRSRRGAALTEAVAGALALGVTARLGVAPEDERWADPDGLGDLGDPAPL
jgi:hypothetical protein